MPVDQQMEFIEIIVSETQRLTRLINDVLDLARMDSGNIKWTREHTDMVEVVHDAVNARYQIYKNRVIDHPALWLGDCADGSRSYYSGHY